MFIQQGMIGEMGSGGNPLLASLLTFIFEQHKMNVESVYFIWVISIFIESLIRNIDRGHRKSICCG